MPKEVRRVVVFVVFAVVGLLSSYCPAQSERATLSGRVTDPKGAVIVGAQVEATNTDTNVGARTQTNKDGLYVIPGLIPGHYRLTVSKEGFKTITKVDVVLHVQDLIAQNIELPIGSISESVTVSANAGNLSKTYR
jgi:carboxypeptidase family protein